MKVDCTNKQSEQSSYQNQSRLTKKCVNHPKCKQTKCWNDSTSEMNQRNYSSNGNNQQYNPVIVSSNQGSYPSSIREDYCNDSKQEIKCWSYRKEEIKCLNHTTNVQFSIVKV